MSSGIARIYGRWRGSLVAKMFTTCFAATHLPLIATLVYLMAGGPAKVREVVVLVLVATLLATIFCLWMMHHLVRPVQEMAVFVAGYCATGRADYRASGRHDELGRLENGIEQMVSSLDSTLTGLRRQAYTDPLTGIGNRRWLDKIGGNVIGRARHGQERIMVITFDLDHFKAINDTMGHAVGDRVLLAVACQVQRLIRQYDLFARTGGEEFCIVMQGTSGAAPGAIAEQLRQSIEEMVVVPLAAGQITASFGVHLGDPFEEDLASMIEAADRQLYRAKEGGRNRISISEIEAPKLAMDALPIMPENAMDTGFPARP